MGKYIRKPYLINKAMRSYIIASLMTTAISQMNSMADGILMGQFISPDALSAITIAMPAVTVITVFYILLSSGAALLAGKALGARENEKVSDIFSVSIMSLAIAGAVVSCVTWIFAEPITRLVCSEENIFPYAKDYLQWTMGLSLFTMLSQAFSQFTDIGGRPQIVTKSMTVAFFFNILFDIILVPGLGMGINGSAIASAVSVTASGLFLARYLFSGKSPYHFHVVRSGFLSILTGNMKNGLPMMFGMLLMVAISVFMNNTVMGSLGSAGMFTMSIVSSVMGICSLLSTAASQTFVAVGGMLFGQKDYHGMHLLFNRCIVIILAGSIFFTIVGQIFPEAFAYIYGARDPELIASVTSNVRIFTVMLIPFQLLGLLPSVYQILGHMKLVGVLASLFFVILMPTMYFFAHSSHPELLWWAFPIAAYSGIIVCIVSLFIVHRNIKGVATVSLIPDEDKDTRMLDISVPCSVQSRDEAFHEMRSFVKSLNLSSQLLTDNISVCIEEVIDNIVQFSGMSQSHYIDVRIVCTRDELTVTSKDNGAVFDPLTFDRQKRGLGMTIIYSLCPKVEYKYMYSQNMTFLSWNLTSE